MREPALQASQESGVPTRALDGRKSPGCVWVSLLALQELPGVAQPAENRQIRFDSSKTGQSRLRLLDCSSTRSAPNFLFVQRVRARWVVPAPALRQQLSDSADELTQRSLEQWKQRVVWLVQKEAGHDDSANEQQKGADAQLAAR